MARKRKKKAKTKLALAIETLATEKLLAKIEEHNGEKTRVEAELARLRERNAELEKIHYMTVTLKLTYEPRPIEIKNVLRVSNDKHYFTLEHCIDNQHKIYHEPLEKVEWSNVEHG